MLGLFTTARAKLKAIEEIMARSQRGVHKRIDENRELLELLKEQAPEFLEKHFWVEGWLRSQDEFLNDLQKAVQVPNPFDGRQIEYPRPWPGRGNVVVADKGVGHA